MDDDSNGTGGDEERQENEKGEADPASEVDPEGEESPEAEAAPEGVENSGENPEPQVVTEGPFEREVDLSREEVAAFLRDLADQIDEGTDLTVAHDDWEVPFSFREPIEVEVEVEEGEEGDDRELEIELEFEE